NNYYFQDLSNYYFSWEILKNGESIKSGTIKNINIQPQNSKSVLIPVNSVQTDQNSEYLLNIACHLKNETKWAPENHEIAFEQFILQEFKNKICEKSIKNENRLFVEEKDDYVNIIGSNFSLIFSKTKGVITSIMLNKKEIIKQGPEINLWRAPTDNDKGGWNNSFYLRWREAGIDSINKEVKSIQVNKSENEVEVVVNEELIAKAGKYECSTTYKIMGNGLISVENNINTRDSFPPLPRIGNLLKLSTDLINTEWYGRGPHENYPDRKFSAKIGLYNKKVNEHYVPYIKPQEYGNKTDTRWLKIISDDEYGIKLIFPEPLNFSIHEYSLENLSNANHTIDLKKADYLSLYIDFKQAGLGGDDSWSPRTHREFQIKENEFQFTYYIKLIENN
ncbi:beta-galactosidase domain 4-containing protein, partial [Bacteroidota bacterium]